MLNSLKQADRDAFARTARAKATAALILLIATVATHAGRCKQVKATTVHTSVEEGALVSKAALLEPAPADEDHVISRRVIANEEGELSSGPTNTRILVVHYRALTKLGPSDDRIVLATPENGNYRVLKVFNSNTTQINGELSSVDDYDARFITLSGFRFLYIRNSQGKVIDDLVYTVADGGSLMQIPFPNWKPTLLRKDEHLANNHCISDNDGFECEAGIYLRNDSEPRPSDGTCHSNLKLRGEFKYDEEKHTFAPHFHFVLDKEWRADEQ